MRVLVLTSLAASLVFTALPAAAQEETIAAEGEGGGSASRSDGHPDDLKMVGWLGFGFGGTVESTVSLELDATIHLGARLEIPITDFLALGGQYQMGFWRSELQDDRNAWFDLDFVVKGFYLFDVGGFALEAYALLPTGFTYAPIRGNAVDGGPGWNIGLLFGAAFYFIEDLAMVLEMGWQHHHTWHDTDLAGIEIDYKTNQFVLNVGVVIPF